MRKRFYKLVLILTLIMSIGMPSIQAAEKEDDDEKLLVGLFPDTLTSTQGPVQVSVLVSLTGGNSNYKLSALKWAEGNRNEAYFESNGTNVDNYKFAVSTNGVYTVFVKDRAGRVAMSTIAITNITAAKPTIAAVQSPLTPTSGSVEVTVIASAQGSDNAITQLKWTEGERNEAFFAGQGVNITNGGKFSLSNNGIYTVYAKDKVGNEAVSYITITNILKTKPIISTRLSTEASSKDPVEVTVTGTAQGDGNAIAQIKWSDGDRNEAYFATAGNQVANGGKFKVTTNGSYTIYAKDTAGNEAVKKIDIWNIVATKPVLSTVQSPDTPTKGPVDVTVIASAQGTGNMITLIKWADGNRNESYFSKRGSQIANGGKFTVSNNGIYTIYTRDKLGEEVVKTVNITNIMGTKPKISTAISPTASTTGTVQVTVSAIIQGEGNTLSQLKWDSGERNEAYFDKNGYDISNSGKFSVAANGTYTVYARDRAGNTNVAQVKITNIVVVPAGNWCTSVNDRIWLESGKSGQLKRSDQITISIPTGSTNRDLCFTLEQAGKPDKQVGLGYTALSKYFRWDADQAFVFYNPVSVSIAYDRNILRNNQVPVIYSYDYSSGVWTELGGTYDDRRITVNVNRVTTGAVYAVFGRSNLQVSFSDINGHWAAGSIREAASLGMVSGDPNGKFRPNASVTRAEFIVMAMNAIGKSSESASFYFKDQADIGSWARNSVGQAVRAGYITGYSDGSFRPNEVITRAEMAVIVSRILNMKLTATSTIFNDDHLIPKWAKGAVESLRREGILTGKTGGRFEPNDKATRAESVVILLRVLEVY
ncbi:MAG: S-layer homology domain-containing protein [Candidatus Pristimantibacillus sp.]